jgi:hypothetical protein
LKAERIAPASKPAYAGKVAIRHVVEAARLAGLDPAGIEALPDGTIRVVDARAVPKKAASLFDQLEERGEI